jgi:hypothetical protein
LRQDRIAVEFDRAAGRASRRKMSAQARGRGTVRQRADDQPIAGCARATSTFGNMETHSFCCQGVAKEGHMAKQNLTDRKLTSLKRDARIEDKLGHYDTWDSIVPGFGVRTSATGRRTSVLMTRFPGS